MTTINQKRAELGLPPVSEGGHLPGRRVFLETGGNGSLTAFVMPDETVITGNPTPNSWPSKVIKKWAQDLITAIDEVGEVQTFNAHDKQIAEEVKNKTRCPKCKGHRTERLSKRCSRECLVGRCYFGRGCMGCQVCQ
jgi:hypothetical protein